MSDYILIVDDQDAVRLMFQEWLIASGYKVKAAADGWECLKQVRTQYKPSLILLDYQMPFMTGMEVLITLKKDVTTQKIPVIIVSGTPNIEETAKRNGAGAVLAKPVDLYVLLEAINNLYTVSCIPSLR
jgi:CheY-like chemotaxis protein